MEIRDRRRGFLWINNEIIDDYATQLGPTALLVYMYLCRYAHNETGRCWPKQDALAEFCQVSDRSIRTAVSVLKSAGLISVELGSIGGSGYRSNIYTLLETVGSRTQTVGNKLPMVCETVGSERPKPQEATDTLTRLIEQDLINLAPPSSEPDGRKVKKPDPRHTVFRDKLEKFWGWLNPDLTAFAWGPAEAGQLSQFLRKWPNLPAEEFRQWLCDYADSDGIVPTKTPRQFLPFLHEYANGPLNKFHKPKDGHAQA